MTKPNGLDNGSLRLTVVIPVVLVFLGTTWLLFNARKPAQESPEPVPAGNDSRVPSSASQVSSQMVRRSATYRLGPPLRSAPSQAPAAEPPIDLVAKRETTPPVETPDTGSSTPPANVEAVVLADSGIEISGRVVLAGKPPPEVPIDMSADPRCGVLHPEPMTTRHYRVGEDGGLADVLSYVRSGLNSRNFITPTNTPVLDQVGCLYQPYVMGVMVNQKFKIRNSDATLHNVHPRPKQGDNREFNLAQPTKGMVSERSFSSPEIFVQFRCDVHPWMFAYVAVLEQPWFAVTDTNGVFKLPSGLPPGKYTIEAIHPKAGAVSKETEVRIGEKKSLDFSLRVPAHP